MPRATPPRHRAQAHAGRQALIAIALSLVARDARAFDPFEIQVYDGIANEPGALSLEQHVNVVARGVRTADPPEAPSDRQGHWTFEGALGVTPWFEPGIYLQTAYVPDVGAAFAGAKLRAKFVTPPSLSKHVRFGLNTELGALPKRFDRDVWGGEVRPIAALDLPFVRAAFNPIVDLSAGSFEPAVIVQGRIADVAAIGAEYYGETKHGGAQYVFATSDLALAPGWALEIGVGHGLNRESDPAIFKMILGIELARLWSPQASGGNRLGRGAPSGLAWGRSR